MYLTSLRDIVLTALGHKNNFMKKFQKPKLLAQGSAQMADCRPNKRPCGRPCNPPGPGGRR